MFDIANDRLSYSELLQPDVGYSLDIAVGMTYSLDLEALLGVPISLGLLDDPDPQAMDSPLVVLEAIRNCADRIVLFCNAGGIKLPNKIQSVFSLLENSVFQVALPNGGNFHPKLWVLKYHNDDGASYIKLIILSRNLTFDTSIDLCIALSGSVRGAKRKKNYPLADFLTFVSGYANKDKAQKVQALAEDVRHVASFELSHPFDDYDILPLGINGYGANSTGLFDAKRDLFVVSPFLSNGVVQELTQCRYRKALVTRRASITKEVYDAFDEIYITKEVLTDNEYQARQDIHAKLYFTTTETGNYLCIGSANASHNAFHRNVEILLRLKYRPNCVGYLTLLKDFIPDEGSPFERVYSLPEVDPEDPKQKAAEEALREAVFSLKRAKASAEGDSYRLTVTASPLKTSEKVFLAPLQRQTLSLPLERQTVFEGLLLKELSAFFVVSVGDERVIVKIETSGIPPERDQAIYRGIIDTKAKFLSYLSLMLSDNLAIDLADLSSEQHSSNALDNSQAGGMAYSAVYEKMLRIFHQDRGRLHGIADMIRRLDPDVVGDEFTSMYQQFEQAARRRKQS